MLELEANEQAGYDLETDDNTAYMPEVSPVPWHITFREQRQKIIELWDVCFVSIIHRTQFYMLFKGEPADEIYMEVELRRLNWLQQHLAEHGNVTPGRGAEEPTISISSRLSFLLKNSYFQNYQSIIFLKANFKLRGGKIDRCGAGWVKCQNGFGLKCYGPVNLG